MESVVREALRSQPPKKTLSSSQHSLREEKLKEAVINLFISRHSSSSPLSRTEAKIQSLYKKLIEDHIPSFYAALRTTPTHPPYAVMVVEAIKGLNKKRGSNLEAISKYIEANYEGLPWAHSNLLKHHLSKLVETDEIIFSSNACYLLPNPNPILIPKIELEQKLSKRGRRRPPEDPTFNPKYEYEQKLLKRGRGRPPKDPSVNPKNENQQRPKRGRGRPPKDPTLNPKNEHEQQRPKRGRGRPPRTAVNDDRFVSKTEIVGSSGHENGCLMELCNSSKCESEGNVLVGPELIKSMCDQNDDLVELGNINECEPEGNVVTSCDGDDCFKVLGNNNELELEEECVERTEFIRSSCHEAGALAFGDGNNLETVIEVEPLPKKHPRSPANNCDFGPVHQQNSEENHPTVEIEVDPLQGKCSEKRDSTQSCAVDDNPTGTDEVEPFQKQQPRNNTAKNGEPKQLHLQETTEQQHREIDANPAVGTEVRPLQHQQQFMRLETPPGKPEAEQNERSECTQSCADEQQFNVGSLLQERPIKHTGRPSKKHKIEQIGTSESICPCADDAIEVGLMFLADKHIKIGTQLPPLQQQQPKPHLRPRPPPVLSKDPTKEGSLQPKKHYNLRSKPPKKYKSEQVERIESREPCADGATEDALMPNPDKHLNAEIELVPLQQQQPKRQLRPRPQPVQSTDLTKEGSLQLEKQVKLRRRLPKKHKYEQVERKGRRQPCADDATEDGLTLLHHKHKKVEIEVAYSQQPQPKHQFVLALSAIPSTDLAKVKPKLIRGRRPPTPKPTTNYPS